MSQNKGMWKQREYIKELSTVLDKASYFSLQSFTISSGSFKVFFKSDVCRRGSYFKSSQKNPKTIDF